LDFSSLSGSGFCYAELESVGMGDVCWMCEKMPTKNHYCDKYKEYLYCGPECNEVHWKESHEACVTRKVNKEILSNGDFILFSQHKTQ
jgi:hypothetical protein